MKLKITLALIFALVLFVAIYSTVRVTKLLNAKAVLENNIRLGYEEGFRITEYYKAKNGDLVARNRVLQLTSQQIKNNIAPSVTASLDNLGIKPGRVEAYSENALVSYKEIVARVRDSLISIVQPADSGTRPPDTTQARIFHYSDPWYDVTGILIGDDQRLRISSVDTITQVIFRGARINKKGNKVPGWWIFTPRQLEQVISCKNPSNKIVYSKTIFISK